jgi:hypothetical protein
LRHLRCELNDTSKKTPLHLQELYLNFCMPRLIKKKLSDISKSKIVFWLLNIIPKSFQEFYKFVLQKVIFPKALSRKKMSFNVRNVISKQFFDTPYQTEYIDTSVQEGVKLSIYHFLFFLTYI